MKDNWTELINNSFITSIRANLAFAHILFIHFSSSIFHYSAPCLIISTEKAYYFVNYIISGIKLVRSRRHTFVSLLSAKHYTNSHELSSHSHSSFVRPLELSVFHSQKFPGTLSNVSITNFLLNILFILSIFFLPFFQNPLGSSTSASGAPKKSHGELQNDRATATTAHWAPHRKETNIYIYIFSLPLVEK